MISTSKELVQACLNVVNNYKTLYVLGCFGAPMNEKNKTRYLNAHSFNRTNPHASYIKNASPDTFGFDCVCFIKALFWGWNGNPNEVYGGASYKSNGVPDIGADAMIKACSDVTDDFSNIIPGELVWQPGHVGIYVGNGLAAEATYEPVSGVQLQAVLPMGWKDGYPATGWTKHGKLPWVTYVEESTPVMPSTYRVVLENVSKEDVELLSIQAKQKNWYIQAEEKKDIETPAQTPIQKEQEQDITVIWEPKVNDVVWFNGGVHYGSANSSTAKSASAGEAKITKIVPGKLHPYHLKKTGSNGPSGWVDAGTFTKI